MTEKQMVGGFAHEIRNALSGSKLGLQRVLGYDGNEKNRVSLPVENINTINEILSKLEQKLDLGSFKKLANEFNAVLSNEQTMVGILEMLYSAINRSFLVTHQILEFSKLSEIKVLAEKIYLFPIISKIIDDAQIRIKDSGIQVTIQIDKCHYIRASEIHIYFVLQNLINNAIDSLCSTSTPTKTLTVTACIEGSQLVIKIMDNGQGISKENQDKIFNAFFSTKGANGIGLGLCIVERTISLYEGSIDVQSTLEQTVFTIRFPLS